MKTCLALLVLLPMAVFAQPVSQQKQTVDTAVQSPKDYVKQLYSSLSTTDAQRIYSKDLYKTMQENKAATPEDEVPYLNFNPLCACQDGKVSLRKITRISTSDALMRVNYTLTGQGKRSLVLKLIPDGKTWAVDDVIYPDAGSLKQGLKQDSARQKQRASARP